jgi:hypothetical protein
MPRWHTGSVLQPGTNLNNTLTRVAKHKARISTDNASADLAGFTVFSAGESPECVILTHLA